MSDAHKPSYDPLARATASRRKCLLCAAPMLRTDLPLIEAAIPGTAADLAAGWLAQDLPSLPAVIDIIERSADGEARVEEEGRVRETILVCKEAAIMNQDFELAAYLRDIQDVLVRTPVAPRRLAHATRSARSLREGQLTGRAAREVRAQRILNDLYVAEVFGPFPAVPFPSEWQTDTAMSLARTMYDAREFSAMPILADALQDAGCDNDDTLSHCRDANQTHVRGCWVVDLVLGKE
jgi:hypothetical protein